MLLEAHAEAEGGGSSSGWRCRVVAAKPWLPRGVPSAAATSAASRPSPPPQLPSTRRCRRLASHLGTRGASAATAAATAAATPATGSAVTVPGLQLAGKVALVTGVGPSVESGSVENIGLAVARRLLLEGALVVGAQQL
jgi:hypothetical protein